MTETTPTPPKQPRLSLRPRRESDAEALYPTMSNPDCMRYWSRAAFPSLSALRESFSPSETATTTWKTWAITKLNSDTAIGFVAASTKRKGVSEIGYLIAREEAGKGYAREAVGMLVSRLLGEEGQRRVFADVDPENVGSVRLLEALGFKLEGHLRQEWETHIGARDSLIYGLLADEWMTTE